MILQPINQPDYLPISMLNQLEYCQRRFWLMFVQGEMEVNAPVFEGILQHERAHTAGMERAGEEVTLRRVYVYSESLRLVGFVDLVEIKGLKPSSHISTDSLSTKQGEVLKRSEIYPVEYKRGRMGKWLNDHIQLCAQAMCLEERTGKDISHGFIFYFGSRRREKVDFTPELRAKTQASIKRAFALLEEGKMPPPLENLRKCRDCSLEPVCLPREVRKLQVSR